MIMSQINKILDAENKAEDLLRQTHHEVSALISNAEAKGNHIYEKKIKKARDTAEFILQESSKVILIDSQKARQTAEQKAKDMKSRSDAGVDSACDIICNYIIRG